MTKPKLIPDTPLVHAMHPSPNFGERKNGLEPYILVLHYTGLPTVERSIAVLSDPRGQVSCHYVIDADGRITQMVCEAMRAWHAGVSWWEGESDINSASVGIEIHNPGHSCGYPDFGAAQMRSVRDLCLDIMKRHTIAPRHVLAHSDIAPSRKMDPGEKFDWCWLARAGVGHWVAPEPVREDADALCLGAQGKRVREMQQRLAAYGYLCPPTAEFDRATEYVVLAFQRHFRPALVDGRFDHSCAVTLDRLIGSLPKRGAPSV